MNRNKIIPFFYKMIPGIDVAVGGYDGLWQGGVPEAAPAPPAPPPPPPTTRWGENATEPLAAGTKKIGKKNVPIGQFGNRLDTEAGRAKEWQMREVAAALEVAQSHANRGEKEAAEVAIQRAGIESQDVNRLARENFDRIRASGKKVDPGAIKNAQKFNFDVGEHIEEIRRTVNNFPVDNGDDDDDDNTTSETPRTPTNDFNYGGYGGYSSLPPSPVLIPGRDVINFTTGQLNADAMLGFIFEDLGGTEIITLMKRDTIDGLDPSYVMISNIAEVRANVNATPMISNSSKTDSYFNRFAISLLDKIPDDEYITNANIEDFYYIDLNGDLVIEFDNLLDGELVEIDIVTSGTIKELDN